MISVVAVIVLAPVWMVMVLSGPSMYLCLVKRWSWSHWKWQLPSLLSFSVLRTRIASSIGNKFGSMLLNASSAGASSSAFPGCSSQSDSMNDVSELNEDDLKQLMSHIDESDGGPSWQFMMERSTPTLAYQAWYRDPLSGPTMYRTRTVFWNVSPEIVRDFFWDDEFRSNWDKMLIYHRTLHVFPQTGAMIVHWLRKLPLLCSDREYIIIRRIWEARSTCYCVTKGTAYTSLPRHGKSKRVDLYYSSWCIRPESRDGGQLAGSEVLLFHQEEINIPKRLVKMGIRAGMWGFVKRLDMAMQVYNAARANGAAPSYALLARLTTEVSPSTIAIPRLEFNTEKKHMQTKTSALKWLTVGVLIASGIIFANYRGEISIWYSRKLEKFNSKDGSSR